MMPLSYWSCTIEIARVDVVSPNPSSYKQKLLANHGQKVRHQSIQVIQSCTAIGDVVHKLRKYWALFWTKIAFEAVIFYSSELNMVVTTPVPKNFTQRVFTPTINTVNPKVCANPAEAYHTTLNMCAKKQRWATNKH